ncbi:toll/interleukin-1 receptor domain-containing protein [Glycomyces sp. YM15]|uniref:toll/interleukin-1 receptor domain-containing protein n=1 Tax=Glycomyces sp. YM15 TaxID=2800446 RepID=UPI001964B647|nr:toll/interleukin-1 receptor domain-containing protein [Glycomyces sp. YM15]
MRRTRWDVFISHAYEDKEGFVRDLAEELRRGGVRVWYDEFTLTAGDSLRESIDRGIADAHIGVVVLSQNFFRKNWARHELNGIFSLSVNEDRRLIPIWLDVTAKDVGSYSPMLVDRVAILASKGLSAVKDEIRSALWQEKFSQLNREINIFRVVINDKMRDVLSPAQASEGFEHGLPTEAIFGVLREPIAKAGDLTPGNFLENRFFADFLHEVIARKIYQSPRARKQARDQQEGYLYLIDGRTQDPQGEVPPEDIIGAVELSNGEMVPGSYQRNYQHRLFTWSGFFVLPDDLEHAMVSEIFRTGSQKGEDDELRVSLDDPFE